MYFYVFFWGVLYDSINTTYADENLEWRGPTTIDVTDVGNDWCV